MARLGGPRVSCRKPQAPVGSERGPWPPHPMLPARPAGHPELASPSSLRTTARMSCVRSACRTFTWLRRPEAPPWARSWSVGQPCRTRCQGTLLERSRLLMHGFSAFSFPARNRRLGGGVFRGGTDWWCPGEDDAGFQGNPAQGTRRLDQCHSCSQRQTPHSGGLNAPNEMNSSAPGHLRRGQQWRVRACGQPPRPQHPPWRYAWRKKRSQSQSGGQ